jgi:hypothetical protein
MGSAEFPPTAAPSVLQALGKKHDIEWHFELFDEIIKRYNVKL